MSSREDFKNIGMFYVYRKNQGAEKEANQSSKVCYIQHTGGIGHG